ncbi:uncharacterized protein ASPGLDRAFT_42287 [Aspergillus glaucus CBS 516.65]|uniref:Uncharacterized protein n=1 Tax=Aspergillus glaucus CBS 516.65 TaxID=1160497 RepID=A0A1L9VXR0_ASPGL|nr:hypothetical protein ASPGLDRAFT_42287 [Aspergillus glaucus CBS 516.65]OJJ88713.1 hypothetical protein ASPGLDRAFT_42287 [Aspergillus glaucus CBS 516.65]
MAYTPSTPTTRLHWSQVRDTSLLDIIPRQAKQGMLHSTSGDPVVSWSIWMLCVRGTSPLLVRLLVIGGMRNGT